MKTQIAIFFVIMNLCQSTALCQTVEDRMIPKPLVDSILFGVGAGLLCGFLILPRDGWSGQYALKGASLGLYGGAALGLYLSYGKPSRPPTDDIQPESRRDEGAHEKQTLLSLAPVESGSRVTGSETLFKLV